MAETDDTGEQFTNLKDVLKEVGVDPQLATNEDLLILRYACETVSNRSADLAAAGVCALLQRMGRKVVTVAVDGTVYKKHPRFADRMKYTVEKLQPWFCKAKLTMSEDGSGLGAALVAAVASRSDQTRIFRDHASGSLLSELEIDPGVFSQADEKEKEAQNVKGK